MATATRTLSTKEADIQMMLAAEVHLGTKNCDFQMERYVFKRRNDGIYIINLGKTWEKLMMAARVIVAIENPQDIIVQSARPYGHRHPRLNTSHPKSLHNHRTSTTSNAAAATQITLQTATTKQIPA
ncbi:unnamed protein product [Fraxinus pennsylvanica]|uniref:40S ribosomal protein SA n=1 Tax=Fraxinus pennsylvanica TaxID=56036 RepID=A0AAD2DP19_9LAMI|nr:unnamed protein product [Fraxinus pennsylvanica]